MKRHGRPVLPALALLVPLFLSLTHTSTAQQYPLCPLTKQPPSLPTVPYRRCMDAAAASCCTDCKEIQNALAGVSANVSIIMPQLLTPLGPMNEVDYSGTTACDYLYGLDDCQFHLEQLLCALTCNPDSGNYVFVKAGRPILRVCPTYAQEVFGYCKDVSLGTVLVGAGFPTKELLLGRLFTPLLPSSPPLLPFSPPFLPIAQWARCWSEQVSPLRSSCSGVSSLLSCKSSALGMSPSSFPRKIATVALPPSPSNPPAATRYTSLRSAPTAP
ncbi:unnamed protein product [Closterium sp. Naga37s-1]|nr:unnamed protein product [Closterium sp. Naga37s-1]